MSRTIAAIATAPGLGGVGIVRISGESVPAIAEQILSKKIKPRIITHTDFLASNQEVLDNGIALYFKAPHSFTGEDVLELQGHGGPVILNLLLQRAVELGAELARPGEFSERAFLNNKIDLLQAEAIADLISASSEKAALAAQRSLQGEFSKQITVLNEDIIHLRMYVEAAIDFPEEEIDFLNDGIIQNKLNIIITTCKDILNKTKQGVLLQEGIHVVLAGEPNAGKSSLLNALAAREAAIVTDIPGTTRDVLREKIHLNGVPLHIIDTAGFRKTLDVIEQEGIKRAEQEIKNADVVLWIVEKGKTPVKEWLEEIPEEKLIIVYNKIDLFPDLPNEDENSIALSAKTQQGFSELTQKIFERIGVMQSSDHQISARARHVNLLKQALQLLTQGQTVLLEQHAGELLAEQLRFAHQRLGEMTGTFTADDLLGEIFSTFCIGK